MQVPSPTKSPTKLRAKRQLTLKKVQSFLKQTEHKEQEKKYQPGKIQFFNTESCKCRVVNFFGDTKTETFAVKANPNDQIVGACCSNGEVKIYDIYEGNTSRLSGYPCTGMQWKPIHIDNFVTCNCDGSIKWYNTKNQNAYGHYEHQEHSYLCCDYQVNQEWCAFGTDHNTVQLFDNQTMKPIQTYHAGGPEELSTNHHTNRVFSVKCLKNDKNILLSGGWDSTVQVWDVRVKNDSVFKICGPSISADSLDIRKNTLLVGNYQNNNILQQYNIKNGQLIQTLDINEPVNSSSYCFTTSYAHKSEYNLLAVGLTGSNKVKILKDQKVVCEMKMQAAPLSLDFYRFNNKDFLIIGGVQGTIYAVKIKISGQS